MDKENGYIHHGFLLTINKMEIMLFARKMDGTGDHHVE
jgi:hypothetical protein